MSGSPDVIVVGGGVVGLSTAYYLSSRGANVALLEARDVAAGTSGACDGNIIVQSKKPGLVLELAKASAALYPTLIDEVGEDVEYERGGSLMVFDNESDLDALAPIIKGQREAGLDVRLLTPAEAREIQPGIEHVLHASYLASDASVNQLALCFALARAARAKGVDLRLGVTVNGLIAEGDKVAGVRTDRGELRAPAVVLAVGIWTPDIAASVGLRLEIIPRKGHILVTERCAPMIRTALLSPSYVRHKHEANASSAPISGVDSVSFSLHQSPTGTCFLGSSREFVGFDDGASPEIIRAIVRAAVRMFPGVAPVRIARAFAGLRPYTPDGKPVIGETALCRGLYVAAGHEGDGIALGPITGKIISELVLDGRSAWDLAAFSPDRFVKSHVAAS